MNGSPCGLDIASMPCYGKRPILSTSPATSQITFGKLINWLLLELVAKNQFPGITFFEQENRLPPQE